MRFVIYLHVRKFIGKENADSGYYRPIKKHTGKRTGRIDINIADDPLEQALTIFHEVTHLVFDLFSQYETDYKTKTLKKRSPGVKKEWRDYNTTLEKKRKDKVSREELICCKIEAAVKRVFLKYMPKKFRKSLFTRK